MQFWLLQFICVHDKNEKAHVALAGVEQLPGADIAPKCNVIVGGLRFCSSRMLLWGTDKSYCMCNEQIFHSCIFTDNSGKRSCILDLYRIMRLWKTVRGRTFPPVFPLGCNGCFVQSYPPALLCTAEVQKLLITLFYCTGFKKCISFAALPL